MELAGIGLLGVRAHQHLALEDAAGLVVYHALEDLIGAALRDGVLNHGGGIAVLVAAHQIGAAEADLGAGADQSQVQFVATEAGTESEDEPFVSRFLLQPAGGGGEVEGGAVLALDLVVAEAGAGAEG